MDERSEAGDEAATQRFQKLRDLRAQLSFLNRADGSCALEQGRTVIWCGINGPGDAPSAKRLSERLAIDVVYKHGHAQKNAVKIIRLVSAALEHTVDCVHYPRAVLSVTIHGMQEDGSEAAAALNAACLAALDSGVVMKGTFCGVAVALSSGNLILDPDYAQCHSADAVFTFAFHLNEKDSKRMLACDTDGAFEYNTFEAARSLATEASADIFMFYREMLQRKLSVDVWK